MAENLGRKVDAGLEAGKEKLAETGHKTAYEYQKEKMKDSSLPIGERASAMGEAVKEKFKEMTSTGNKERAKEEMKH
jgi:hypothetical protein